MASTQEPAPAEPQGCLWRHSKFGFAGARRGVWLGLPLVGWIGLAVLSRWPGPGAILWTNRLFGWVVLLTGFSLWAGCREWVWAQPARRRRFVRVNLALCVAWLGLELLAGLNLSNWSVLLDRWIAPCALNHQYRTAFVLDRKLEFRRPLRRRWSGPAATDLEVEWLVRPDNPRSLTFHYDARGYRNWRELDRAEILLLGDSFVEGWGVSDAETTARVLEAKLGKPVANLGVAGYGTMQEFEVLQLETPRLRPAVVVWCYFEGNDFYDDWRWERAVKAFGSDMSGRYAPGQPVARAHSWRQRSLAPNGLRLLRAWSDPLVPNRLPHFARLKTPSSAVQTVAFPNYAAVPWSPWLAGRWGKTREVLAAGARFCREQRVRLIVCYVPDKFRVYRPFVEFSRGSPCARWAAWDLPEEFALFCRQANIAFLDLTEPLRESVRQGRQPYPPADSHWGPEGHRLVADILAEEIEAKSALPP